LEDLRTVLERAAAFYIRRRMAGREGVAMDEVLALAEDIAQEATLIVLEKLHTFRGEARFVTWADAIAVGLAMNAVRKRMWRDLSLDRVPDGWQAPAERAIASEGWANPDMEIQRRAMWDVITEVARTELTDRQREVLNLLVVAGVDSDEVAERLGMSAGALYKMTHDARRKLKAGLLKRGFTTSEILSAFASEG
jgi:RNA polymerase sigma-70 factor (ECF subfamily)